MDTKRFFRYFLQGLLYTAPIGATIYIVFLIFNFVDGLLNDYLTLLLGFRIPGLGLVIIVVLLTLLGYIGQTIIAKPFTIFFKGLMERTPFLKMMYNSLNDLLSAFVGKEKKFKHPVLVKVNHITNLEKIGFVTQEDLTQLGIENKVAVYFPHSYNFSGELFIVPAELVTPLDVPSSEAMKFIVSGGIIRIDEEGQDGALTEK